MCFSTIDTLINRFSLCYTSGGYVLRLSEFRMLGTIYIEISSNAMCNYMIFDVPTEWHKTRWGSLSPLSLYNLCNPGSAQMSDLWYQHKYWFIYSGFFYTSYIHRYHPRSTITEHLDMYLVPSGKCFFRSTPPDKRENFPTITTTYWSWAPEWSELGYKDEKNWILICSCMLWIQIIRE